MNNRIRFFNSYLVLLVCALVFGCQISFGQYRFDTWTTDNGLPQNGVRSITQTPDGYLWFTTFDGLVRFDGVRFTTFNTSNTEGIINNRFTTLYSDKVGNLYATTGEDGVLTIYRNGVFTSYSSDQVPGSSITRVLPDNNGELRYATVDVETGLREWYYLRDGKFVFSEKYTEENKEIKYIGKSGAQWTITSTEITELRDGKSTLYPYNIEAVLAHTQYFEDSEAGLWITGNKLIRLKDGKIEDHTSKGTFKKLRIFHSFWEDPDGSVWCAEGSISFAGAGLVRFNKGQISVFGEKDGLSNSNINSVFRDREGTTWLGTAKGLNRLSKKVITAYSKQDGLIDSEVYPIYRDRAGEVWIGTSKGLTILSNGDFNSLDSMGNSKATPENLKAQNFGVYIQALFEDSNGAMWLGTSGGLALWQHGQIKQLNKFGSRGIFAIHEDRSGKVWVATNMWLEVYENYKLVKRYSVKDGLPNNFMLLIFEDSKGRLWFGGYGGLSEFRDGKFINYTKNEGLAGNHVRTIYEDSAGTFWIGTYDGGLSRFKDGRFVNYKMKDGLYNNGVFAIEEDKRGNFWISSNGGIYRVNKKELNDFADGKIDKINSVGYGKQDGMLSNECNGGRQPASMRDKDGKFWFPTQDGVVVVDPEAETYNSHAPPVVIESATVEREKVDFSQGLVIEPGQKNIEINYAGTSLIKSEQIKFKYKLENHDADWVDAGTRRTVYYSYLPPGNYRFHVIAANSDGIWNETGATIDLELKPFFYQTSWFYVACSAFGVFILLLIWKSSVYQLKAREKRLGQLVEVKTLELQSANAELQQLANSDGLTSIANRRQFDEFLTSEWNRAVRGKTEISMVLVDIDHFKLFNDTYGHRQGDECLKKVAEALSTATNRPTDLVARFGGEEFAIILGATDAVGAVTIAELASQLVDKLCIEHSASETNNFVTVSIGVATMYPNLSTSPNDLIEKTDHALYQAKREGRNRIIKVDLTQPFNEVSNVEKEHLGIG